MDGLYVVHPCRRSVLRTAWRDHVALRNSGAHVHRHDAMGVMAARRIDACQHCRLRDVRGNVGIQSATAATVGTVAVGEIEKYGYNTRLFLGTIAAGGTLGILIPPSINLVIYGVLTETSIPNLYLAGFVPGFALAGLFMITVLVTCIAKPSLGGRRPRPIGPVASGACQI